MHHSNEPPRLWLVFTLPLTLSPTTSLPYKSVTEVVFYEASTPFAPPASSLACKSEMEKFRGVWTIFGPPPPSPTLDPVQAPPPPSRARARRRWHFTRFRPRSLPRLLPRPRSTPFEPPPLSSHERARRTSSPSCRRGWRRAPRSRPPLVIVVVVVSVEP